MLLPDRRPLYRDEMTRDTTIDFGEVRELTHGKPTRWRFRRIWDLCERVLSRGSAQSRDETLTFTIAKMKRWPSPTRQLPSTGFLQWLDHKLPDELVELVGSISNHGYDLSRSALDRVAALTRRVAPTHIEPTNISAPERAWRAFFESAELSSVESLDLQRSACGALSQTPIISAERSSNAGLPTIAVT